MQDGIKKQVEEYLINQGIAEEQIPKLVEALIHAYDQASSHPDRQEDEHLVPSKNILMNILSMTADVATIVKVLPDGTFEREWYSDGFEKLLGYTSEELDPVEGYKRIVHPDDLTIVRRFRATIYNNNPSTADLRCIAKNGEIRWLRIHVHPDMKVESGFRRLMFAFTDITEQKNLIQERETSHAVLRAILDSTIDGVEVIERGGNLVTLNKKFIELWRLSSKWHELVSHQERLRPMALQTSDPERFLTRVHTIMAHPEEVQYDIIEMNDGRVLERYATRYSVGKGNEGIVWSYRDLTERQHAENSLSVRLQYEEALSEVSAILFASTYSDNAINEALKRIQSSSKASRVYIFENELDSNYGICTTQTHECCAEGVEPQAGNLALQHIPFERGFQRWIEVLSKGDALYGSVATFPDSEREALEIQGIKSILVLPIIIQGDWYGLIGFDDVETEREWSEHDIRLLHTVADMLGVFIHAKRRSVDELEYKFRAENKSTLEDKSSLWQEFHLSVFKTNPDGIVDAVEGENAPFGNLLKGVHYSRAFNGHEDAFERALRNGYSNFAVTHNAALYTVDLRSKPNNDDGNCVYGFIRCVGDDERSDGFREEIIGIVSHELRNPLSSVLGALKLIKGGAAGELPEKADALVDIARNNGERLLHLLNDIIDVEKIEAGTLEFQFEPYELYKTVQEAVALNGAFAQSYGVKLELQGEFNPVKVIMDKGRILQVLTNFISNAVKFSPEGQTVWVRMLEEGENVRVEVEDGGPGIPVEFRPKIFQKFAHREPQRESMRAGAGLGLSISKAIVDRHDGHIGFDTVEDEGTTFYFTLARAKLA